mgnify:CR=1 FL=1
MPMEELLGNNPRNQKKERNTCDELFASRPKRPDEYHEGFILRGDAL